PSRGAGPVPCGGTPARRPAHPHLKSLETLPPAPPARRPRIVGYAFCPPGAAWGCTAWPPPPPPPPPFLAPPPPPPPPPPPRPQRQIDAVPITIHDTEESLHGSNASSDGKWLANRTSARRALLQVVRPGHGGRCRPINHLSYVASQHI